MGHERPAPAGPPRPPRTPVPHKTQLDLEEPTRQTHPTSPHTHKSKDRLCSAITAVHTIAKAKKESISNKQDFRPLSEGKLFSTRQEAAQDRTGSYCARMAGGGGAAEPMVTPGVDQDTNSAHPRRGSRRRQPTRKAEEQTQTEAQIRAPRGKSASAPSPSANREAESAAQGENADGESDEKLAHQQNPEDVANGDDGEEENDVYCVCRGRDDGTPMVECAGCDDWCVSRRGTP